MICPKCNIDKGTDFRKNKKCCRECDNEAAREYRKKLKEKKKPDHIICNVCNEEKTEFRINRKKCLDCERDHGREYRRTTDKAKIWVENNREHMSELQHMHYEREKDNIKEKFKVRYKTDLIFKLSVDHRKVISSLIRGRIKKSSKHLNCTRDRLINWLQYQFDEEMSFENYGTVWVADHVLPVNEFLSGNHSAEIILNWVNIKPILKIKNLRKNKYSEESQCKIHYENIKHYYKIRNLKEDIEYLRVLDSHCYDRSRDTLLRETPKASEHHLSLEKENGEPG